MVEYFLWDTSRRMDGSVSVRERLAALEKEKALHMSRKPLLQDRKYIATLCTQLHLLQQRLRTLETQDVQDQRAGAAPLATIAQVAVRRPWGGAAWVASAFGDPGFAIIRNRGGGDCLFHSVGAAVGATVAELRGIVAAQASQEEYEVKRDLYQSAIDDLPGVRARLARTVDPAERRELAVLARNLTTDVRIYRWMAGVSSLAEYRRRLATRGNWGDAEAVGHLESALGVKLLLLSRCGSSGMAYVNTFVPPGFNPSRYILIAYDDGAHYQLVTYNETRIFSFESLPGCVRELFDKECPQYSRDILGWGVPVGPTKNPAP